MLGDAAFEVGLAWAVIQTTGSMTALAGVLLFRAVPRSVLLLLGGAIVDRFSPRLVMLICHVVSAIVMVFAAVTSANGETVLCGGQGIVFWSAAMKAAMSAKQPPVSASAVIRSCTSRIDAVARQQEPERRRGLRVTRSVR